MNKTFDDNNTVALWTKQSKSGSNYYSGYAKIDNKEYEVVLFDNTSDNGKAPVLKGKIKDKIDKSTDKNENVGEFVKNKQDEAFLDFGNTIELQDSDIAF